MQYLIIAVLLINICFSKSIKVSRNNYSYELEFTHELIHFKDQMNNLRFDKKSCNQEIIDRLNKKIHSALVLNINNSENFIEIKEDKKIKKIPAESKEGQFLFNLSVTMRTSKIEEQLSCH